LTGLATVLAAGDPDRITVVQFLVVLAFGLGTFTAGCLSWVGRLKPDARYQTFFGGMAASIPGGAGFTILAIGLGLRDALDQPEDWWLWWVLSIVGFGLVMLSVVYLVVYFWFGVPDALRPRPQRGQPKPASLAASRRRR
jgi:hypothetical protein